MQKDNVFIGASARERLIAGVRKTSDAVKITMGTGGSNAVIEAMENPGHLLTNDGWSIANAIKLADPIEEMGRKILLEAINRANKQSGDGSSTTCLLTASILEEGMKYLAEEMPPAGGGGGWQPAPKVSPMEIKRSLEACVPLIEESIKQQTREIGVNEVGKVATISAEDETIGNRIQEIYQEIGKGGIIHWDISKTGKDFHTIGTGITVDGAGFLSPYMCDATETGQSTNQIRIKNPYILLTKQKISSAADFNNIAVALNSKEIKDLVVFADEVDPLVVPDLIKTRMIRGFRFAIVKMPVLWKDWWYEDLAKTTGAKVVDVAAGVALKDVTIEHLGRAENIVVTKDDTFIDGIKDVKGHINDLEALGTDDALLRASRLNTKTARYFVGAQSDSALSYRRLKVEDAISAAWQALQGGIVAGGGSALADISGHLEGTVGGQILQKALKAPAKVIAANAGHPDMSIGNDYSGGRGFDTKSGAFVDMFEAGIVDPAPVVLNAVRNAISVAASILTAPIVVTLPRDEKTT